MICPDCDYDMEEHKGIYYKCPNCGSSFVIVDTFGCT